MEKKIKLSELATELKQSPRALLDFARENGISARTSSAGLTAEDANRMRRHFTKPVEKPAVKIRRRPRQERAPEAQTRSDGTQGQTAQAQDQAPRPQSQEPAAQAQPQTQGARPQGQAAEAQGEGAQARQQQKPEAASRPRTPVRRPAGPAPSVKIISPAPGRQDGTASDARQAESARTDARQSEAPGKDQAAEKPAVTAPAPGAGQEAKAPETGEGAPAQGSAAAESRPAPKPRTPAERQGAGQGRAPGQGGQARQPRVFPQPQEVPKVRIISKPEAPQPQTREGQSRPDRPRQSPGGGRPAGSREGGRPAGAREGARPAAAREGARPGRTSGQSRWTGDFEGGQNADGRGKGNKNKRAAKGVRRTVDFQPAFDRQDADGEGMRQRSARRPKKKPVQAPVPVTQPLKAAKRKVRVEGGSIRIADMAHQMGLKANELIKVLFNMGTMATINQAIDTDTAAVLASEFQYEVEKTGFEESDYLEPSAPDSPESLRPRPPVVTIMGHVDHGKTSLLDAIRKTHVTSGEAGGITQHIGAYHVRTKNGDVVFLDTPGHEAFTAMRARGAQITDLVILVVAADDGVMEQTREAINHARAANVPIIVAVNKIDKPAANPDRVLRELSELGLQAEEWGGDTIVAMVSAKTHQGLDDLLELLALQSEVMELKANPDKPARGHIIEAKLDKGRGPVATVLIQEGTLRQGDSFVCGTFSGRVRALFNDAGKKVREAGPSIPVEVQGFAGVPVAGEEFAAVADERVARRIADARAVRQREKDLASESRVTLETFLADSADDGPKTLNLVVKADVQGSLEAVQESLRKAGTEKVTVNVVHGAAGAISESDIMLAHASRAIIIGFNVRPTARIKEVAARESVDIRFYDIIYKLVDDVKSAMAGLLAPVEREVYLGQAEVRRIFTLPKVGTIAGSYVADGKMLRNASARLLREGVVVWTGRISSLKRFKDDAREVARGNECGIGLENFNDIKVGDIIEAFTTVQEAASL